MPIRKSIREALNEIGDTAKGQYMLGRYKHVSNSKTDKRVETMTDGGYSQIKKAILEMVSNPTTFAN